MQFNMIITSALAALIPLIVGMVWYNPKVFGTAWMNANGFTDPDKMKEGFNMPLVFGLTYVFSFFIAFSLAAVVIHQFGFFSMLQHKIMMKDAATMDFFKTGFDTYGNEFRTFKHGTLHGAILGVTVALPIVAINALFERKGFKYIAIHAGYWIVSLVLMGGFICQFAKVNMDMFK